VLRLAYSLAKASDWTVIYIDCKGDRQIKDRFAALMENAGRRVALFPDDPTTAGAARPTRSPVGSCS
jgi:hypothetical protein